MKSFWHCLLLTVSCLLLKSCVKEPIREDAPEQITKVILTFTPVDGGTPVVVSATDPDGEGVEDITADGTINLMPGKTYTLQLSLINELADVTSPQYDVTSEVEEEGHEHLFFFSFTNNLFSAPSGNGNIDNRGDEIDYKDSDGTNPIGLITQWKASSITGVGTFRIMLKHQPQLKSASSTSADGETDLDLTFEIEVM